MCAASTQRKAFVLLHYLFVSCVSNPSFSDDGVSIPCSYTSFLAPLSSSKLYNEVRGCRERDKDPECHFETPYVVRLHNFHQLADPKACFTFKHPTTGIRKRIDTYRMPRDKWIFLKLCVVNVLTTLCSCLFFLQI